MLITRISGYVDTPIPKKCGTCEHLVDRKLCNQKEVQTDKQISTDPKTGFKKVSAEDGCCNFWDPESKNVNRRELWKQSLKKEK